MSNETQCGHGWDAFDPQHPKGLVLANWPFPNQYRRCRNCGEVQQLLWMKLVPADWAAKGEKR